MKKTELTTPFGATATIYHQGGHITSWIPSAELGEQIFVAEQAEYAQGKAIRGGIPVCFPQFAAFGEGVKHGFARNTEWALACVNNEQTIAKFVLADNEKTRELWPHAFKLELVVTLEPTKLIMALSVTNTGNEPLDFSGALHTYFTVSEFTSVTLSNFKDVTYWDNGTALSDKKMDSSSHLQLDDALDRVYFDAPDCLELTDGKLMKRITKSGFTDVVVWNPGPEGAKSLNDMGDDEYHRMLCIEAAIVDKPITLAPDESWQGVQAVEVKNK